MIKNGNGLEQFTGMYPISKTLRFELIPQRETSDHIQKKGILLKDEQLAENYRKVKRVIDEYHKVFISKVLEKADINWTELAQSLDQYREFQSEPNNKKNLQKFQELKRKEVSRLFTVHENYKDLFNKDLFLRILPQYLEEQSEKDEQLLMEVKSFNRFTTYFTGFSENRKNIYAEKEISSSIAYRIVHDNFPKFLSNLKTIEYIRKHAPDILVSFKSEFRSYAKNYTQNTSFDEWFDEIFSIQGFNKILTQAGIDQYNSILGGFASESGNVKVRGINEFCNLYRQQQQEISLNNPKIKLVPLYKQILSDRSSASFIPEAFATDAEVIDAISIFSSRIDEIGLYERIHLLMQDKGTHNLDKIYFANKEIGKVSIGLFQEWSRLTETLRNYKVDKEKLDLTKKNNGELLDKWLKSEDFSLSTVQKSLELANTLNEDHNHNGNEQIGIVNYYNHIETTLTWVQEKKEQFQDFIKNRSSDIALKDDLNGISSIKSYFDTMHDLLHVIKPFRVQAELDKDQTFYLEFDELYDELQLIVPLYNKVRNYITQKPYAESKYKLNFENPTLASGWDQNKEKDNTAILLMRNGEYFLGVMNANDKPKIKGTPTKVVENGYGKMVYKYFPDIAKMIPKCSTQLKEVNQHFKENNTDYYLKNQNFIDGLMISKTIYDLNNPIEGTAKKFTKEYLRNTGDDQGFNTATREWIHFCQQFLRSYSGTKEYNLEFMRRPETYQSYDEFLNDCDGEFYKITLEHLSVEEVHRWVSEGKLYLFQIYNKDFAVGSNGKPNLHTIYWKLLFDRENLKDVVMKLNGEAELFYRPASIKKPYKHKINEKMINRRTQDGAILPDRVYRELLQYVNTGDEGNLSDEAHALRNRIVIKEVKHEITKDKRFTQDKYLFHVPITINFKASGQSRDINDKVISYLVNNKQVNIIGIDRGERNLLYVSVIDQQGNLLHQQSYNTAGGTNYSEKLTQREQERDQARKSWTSIEAIKDLKEGYLSIVVHELAKLMVQYNAVIILEDLNFGFKRGRFKFERQVYQKFEKMLIEKLNYLVFKDVKNDVPGGALRGFQFTNKFESFKSLGKQSGFLFYVPASFTSKVDPTTGFINAFNLKELTNMEKKRDFFGKFDSIIYDGIEDSFVFQFNYNRFKTFQNCAIKEWAVFTNDKRIVYNTKKKMYEEVNPTELLKDALQKAGITYLPGKNLIHDIMGIEVTKDKSWFFDGLYNAFSKTLQLRNSNPNTGEDYIRSPVKNMNDTFFDSRVLNGHMLPVDADANGAYHIALKGLYILNKISAKLESDQDKLKIPVISNVDWLRFIQNKEFNN
jgi:CRISPR-associated protein Cpf1